MKKYIFMAIAILIGLIASGCSKRTPERMTSQADLAQKTMEHKQSAYDAFMARGGKAEDFCITTPDGAFFDLSDFLVTLGLNYAIYDEEIVIGPNIEYSPEDDFRYVIDHDGYMFYGHDMYLGRQEYGDWVVTEHYDSATDFVFEIVFDDEVYLIGADEFDAIYRTLRTVTTPDLLVEDINKMIDDELSYSG